MDVIKVIEELLPVSSPFSVDCIKKDEAKQEVHIHISVDKSYRPHQHCGHIHQYYDKTWEHTKLFQYRCFIQCRIPVYKNLQTGKTEALQVSFSRSNSRFTLLFEQEVLRLLKIHHCQKKVAQQLNIRTQRVEHIYHSYTQQSFEEHTFEPPEQIGIDETSTRKGHNYFSIIVDLETRKPIDIQLGRGADVIGQFFHNNVNPSIVKQISIDMSTAFICGCKTFFPWVQPTYDKWHVYKLLSKHLYNLQKKHADKSYNIDTIWEALIEFYQQTDYQIAQANLTFIADYSTCIFGEKNKLSKSILRHFDGIVQNIKSSITNGVLEGINSKIQTLKRVARGFRYTENFMKMVLFIFGVIEPRIQNTT